MRVLCVFCACVVRVLCRFYRALCSQVCTRVHAPSRLLQFKSPSLKKYVKSLRDESGAASSQKEKKPCDEYNTWKKHYEEVVGKVKDWMLSARYKKYEFEGAINLSSIGDGKDGRE